MKNLNLLAVALTSLAGALAIPSCQIDDIDTLGKKYSDQLSHELAEESRDQRGFAEKSTTELTKDWWKYVMSFNCENNPLLGAPSLRPAEGGTSAPVVFLVGSKGGAATRNIEIFKNQILIVPIVNILNDYPCGDESFRPRPGQTVEQFLKTGADRFIDQATSLRATLDGKQIRITKDHRIATDLFYFTGNKDLTNCLDYCVTGQSQAAVSDGYWLVVKSLLRGKHVLVVHAEVPGYDIVLHTTYNIIVR